MHGRCCVVIEVNAPHIPVYVTAMGEVSRYDYTLRAIAAFLLALDSAQARR
jgi:hypothetical protein